MHVLPLATAQDHKRVGDGDTGPNTGGMGAYSPAPVMTPAMVAADDGRDHQTDRRRHGQARHAVQRRAVRRLDDHAADGPKLIEFNARFGDPETQVLMMRLKSDLLTALIAAADGALDKFDLRWQDDVALTVVMAANGYPGRRERQRNPRSRRGGEDRRRRDFSRRHRGPRATLVAAGGRVLNVTAHGQDRR